MVTKVEENEPFNKISLLGTQIHKITVPELLGWMESTIDSDRRARINYVNAQALNLAYKIPWFQKDLNQNDIIFCDGFGVKWGAKLVGESLPSRLTPPDWIDQLIDLSHKKSLRLFFLGGKHGVAEKARAKLLQHFSEPIAFETHHGYFDKSIDSAENKEVIQKINEFKPHILLVGFGMPIQEKWLSENWDQLNANIGFPVGAMMDFIAGEVRRGPRWMTDSGFEWLSRLIIEPRRLWKRYLVGNPLFIMRVLKQRIKTDPSGKISNEQQEFSPREEPTQSAEKV